MPKFGTVVSIDHARLALSARVREAIVAHLDGLYRFALRLTRDRDGASELVQESALRALEQPSGAIHNLRAWLFQTLYHLFVNDSRRAVRQEALPDDWEEAPGRHLSASLPDLIALEDIRRALEGLPGELRTVVWLSDAEDFRLREIAEILGWPIGTVASRLWRARVELRQRLSAYRQPFERRT